MHISNETGGNCVIHTPQGKSLRFQHDTGICLRFLYLDMSEAANLEGYLCVKTMRQKYERFMTKEIEQAVLGRNKQIQLGLSSDRQFMEMVSKNHVKTVL